MAAHEFPVGKAQQQVLDALNLSARSFQDAERIFAAHGLTVSTKRAGRISVPVIRQLDSEIGGWELGGYSGSSERVRYQQIDLTPVAQWVEA